MKLPERLLIILVIILMVALTIAIRNRNHGGRSISNMIDRQAEIMRERP